VYDHTPFASYLHLRVKNVGGKYDYWLLEGNKCSAAGGFPSNPILSGSAPNSQYYIKAPFKHGQECSQMNGISSIRVGVIVNLLKKV
jgi:hypothetical protein